MSAWTEHLAAIARATESESCRIAETFHPLVLRAAQTYLRCIAADLGEELLTLAAPSRPPVLFRVLRLPQLESEPETVLNEYLPSSKAAGVGSALPDRAEVEAGVAGASIRLEFAPADTGDRVLIRVVTDRPSDRLRLTAVVFLGDGSSHILHGKDASKDGIWEVPGGRRIRGIELHVASAPPL